jgi:hypothetical protein
MKSAFRAFLTCILVGCLTLVFVANFGVVHAATDVSGIIGSDATWTKAGSPYSLTGNMLVGNGATLTIEAGVTVNLNDYYIMVNGTLRAIGSSTDQIHFNSGEITFTQHSNDWDEQTGSGCIIEYANLEPTEVIINSASPKINRNSISKIAIGGSTILTNNIISQEITDRGVPDSPVISDNTILQGGFLTVSGSAVVSNNVITGAFTVLEGSAVISNNNVSGSLIVSGSAVVSNNIVSDSLDVAGSVVASNNTATTARAGGSATITNSTILGKVSVTKSDLVTISNNRINGGISLGGRDYINASIINNTITGGEFGFGIRIAPTSYIFLIAYGRTDAYISGNTIFDCTTAGIEVGGLRQIQAGGPPMYNTALIEGNTIVNAGCGIDASYMEEIRNNIIAYNEIGISDGSLIEGNLIVNNTYGIKGGEVIQNNTIVNNSVGVEGGFTTLVYNNIYNNSEYNVRFTSPETPNATYNWWGTTDTQAINQTIYDYKNDFYLANLNFVPFLTEPNPEAPSTQITIIPEFPSWLLIPLFLVATFAVIVFRKRLVC